MIDVLIPVPPSVNNLFLNGARKARRVKAPHYQAWISDAGWIIRGARLTPVRGPYAICILVGRGTKGDVANREKATTDLFVSLGLTDDDRHAEIVIAAWSDAVPRDMTRVLIASTSEIDIESVTRAMGDGAARRPAVSNGGRAEAA